MATAQPSVHPRPVVSLAGWPLVGWSTLVVLGLAAVMYVATGGGVDGVRAIIRISAKTSLALFLGAFLASSVRALWPTPLTRWMLANRRYLGVSFAASHLVHLIAIITLLRIDPEFELSTVTLIAGGGAYVFIALMVATSFDTTTKWLGARRWKILHKTGAYWIWAIFVVSYLPRALVESPIYLPLALALFAAWGVRLLAWRRHRAALGA